MRNPHLLLIPPRLRSATLTITPSQPPKTPGRGWQDLLKQAPLPEAAQCSPEGSSPYTTLVPHFPNHPKYTGGAAVCLQCFGCASEGSKWNQVQELAVSFAYRRPKQANKSCHTKRTRIGTGWTLPREMDCRSDSWTLQWKDRFIFNGVWSCSSASFVRPITEHFVQQLLALKPLCSIWWILIVIEQKNPSTERLSNQVCPHTELQFPLHKCVTPFETTKMSSPHQHPSRFLRICSNRTLSF